MKVTLFRDLPSEGWFSMERYADELYAALRALDVDARQYVFPRPLPHLRGRAGAWFNHFWRMAAYPLAARTAQSDVNHILDHSYAHLLHTLDPRRTVVTCHDIAPLALNEGRRGLSRRLWEISLQAMETAAQLVVISESTRQEVLRFTRYPPAQVTKIYYGVNPQFRQRLPLADLEALRLQLKAVGRPILVHIGSCAPRKNLDILLQNLPQLLDLNPLFVQVGGHFSSAQNALIDRLGLAPFVHQAPAAQGRTLLAWYQVADVFVFPSIYEGFGLPVLEAMAAGVPVVCSNATSLPEVAGDAALYFDPQDGTPLVAHLRALLRDAALRSNLIKRGLAQSHKFTWEATAQATLAVYHQL